MAIQLNERDYLIFKLLAEHRVLLEKHIAWFITDEEKPVLIRDRLRKLFYLDYVLCHRYDGKLSWWSTPTKPLIYMLAPLGSNMSGVKSSDSDITEEEKQKCLELANLRMIFLIAQREGFLQSFQWRTGMHTAQNTSDFDALISFNGSTNNFGITFISDAELKKDLVAYLQQRLINGSISNAIIVCKEQSHKERAQEIIRKSTLSDKADKLIFCVHQDLYKSGLNKAAWTNLSGEQINLHNVFSVPFGKTMSITTSFQQAASA